MNKEMICKNCKYHYIEEISFDYPQSCCSKRMATTEEWCKCNDFEYGNRYIELLQQENQQLQEELKCTIGIVEHNRIISEKNKETHQLKDNWNKLKDYIVKEYYMYLPLEASTRSITILIDKMHELEKGDK